MNEINKPYLWSPSAEQIKKSNMLSYMDFLNKNNALKFGNYADLYQWSIEHADQFWESIWNYAGIISHKKYSVSVENLNSFKNVNWFPGALLNYTENLLQKNNNESALIFRGEDKIKRNLTWKDLNNQVSSLQQYYKSIGIKKGDRIAFCLPNIPETVVCVLAAASLGAISSLCSPEFGVQAVIDRFSQIEPVLFIYGDHYIYNGKKIDTLEKSLEIMVKIPALKNSLCISYEGTCLDPGLRRGDTEGSRGDTEGHRSNSEFYLSLLEKYKPQTIYYEYVPFNHPLYIMFSSGTTGIPKCIVHGVGGTLIQHLKEHRLHCDIKEGDKIFYFSTCGWMMWQWLVGALASKATLLLYDGSPFSPNNEVIFQYLEEEKAVFFGTSAKYIDSLKKTSFIAKEKYPLKNLKIIGSTGSPLVAESFDYIYANIKSDVCLSSLSGGTDIISCFVLGNPIKEVCRGEIQCVGLGMKVCVFNEEGKSVVNEKGELVCTLPFPSQPIFFWNDINRKKYDASYFNKYDNIWHHGDWMEITQQGGVIIYGRSDTTLNPGGVRIGTAEIYRQVEQLHEIVESIVVEQQWQGDNRIVLFVVLAKDLELNQQLKEKIKNKLRINCSPRHVPAKIISVPEIPRTKSGKIMENAVKYTIHNREVKNKEAMLNPEVLSYFQDIEELLSP